MNTKQKQNNVGLWIFLSASIVVGALLGVFFILNTRYQQELDKDRSMQEVKAVTETAKIGSYNKCIDDAYAEYRKQWDSKVSIHNLGDGNIPQDEAKFLDNRYKEAKDECFRLYR